MNDEDALEEKTSPQKDEQICHQQQRQAGVSMTARLRHCDVNWNTT
jgi:hypothetical protein